MMLARVADSLYWIGRYIERAEHVSRLSAVMLNATLDQHAGRRADRRASAWPRSATTDGGRADHDLRRRPRPGRSTATDDGSVVVSLARARENARQVRDQITTETWERLNLLYLRVTGAERRAAFDARSARLPARDHRRPAPVQGRGRRHHEPRRGLAVPAARRPPRARPADRAAAGGLLQRRAQAPAARPTTSRR